MPVQAGSAGRDRVSSTVAKPPHRSAARKADARGDAEVPLLAGGAHERRERPLRVHARRAEVPRVGAELGQRDRHEREQHGAEDQPLALGHAAATSGRRSAAQRRAAVRRREADHEPGERILEEAAVEERVHEQPEQARAEREPERLVPPGDPPDQDRGRPEQPRVQREPDDAQLGEHGERRRVRDEVRAWVGRCARAGGWRAAGRRFRRPPPDGA